MALLGRDAELTELCRGLDESLLGRGRLFLLSGEPGIGKTRLCDELARLAAPRGVTLFWGRCWEAGGAPAYWPWLDVLNGLVAAIPAAELDGVLGEGRAALATVVESLRQPSAAEISERPAEARLQLYRSVAALLRHVAKPAGLLLVLEDLHAADESSLLLLNFVARELRSMRVLVLVTFRDVEARLSAQVGEALGRLTREGASLSLGRLNRADSEQLIRSRAADLPEREISDIFARTQGNPLFVQELASLLGSAAGVALGRLPASVREVLRERLRPIDAAARNVLEAAAISGDTIDPALVAVALGQSLAPTLDALSLCEAGGVLVRRADGRFGFFHALVREVLEQDLSSERRQWLHGAVAGALERSVRAPGELPWVELAYHWLEAAPSALPRAVECAISAAQKALAHFAFEEAIGVLERVRAGLERADADWRLRAEVLIALGQAQIRRGTGAAGQALCLEAAALAREHRDPELLARAVLAYGLEIKAALIDRTLITLLEEALAGLPEADSALRVRVMARLGAALQPHRDLMYPIGLAQQAIDAARRIGEPHTLLFALHTGMAAMMDIVDPRVRLPINLETEQLGERLGERESVLRSIVRLAFDHMEIGDLAAADARIDRLDALVRESRALRYAWRVSLLRSMRAQIHGRFHEAEEWMERAQEQGERAEDAMLGRCYTFHHEGLLRAWERHAEMAAFDLTARPLRAALYSGEHWQNGGSAFTYARLEAVEQAAMYIALVPEDDWPLPHNPPAFMHLGEPLALCGAPDVVQRVHDMLLPARERFLSWGSTKFLWDGPATRVLALLAARLGRYDEARAYFEESLQQLERLDAGPYLARTRYEYGRSLRELGRASDRARALALIEQAQRDAKRLDLSGLARLCERRLDDTAAVSPKAAATETGPAVDATAASASSATRQIPQPAELLQLVAEGEFWTLRHAGGSFQMRDSLGLQYLARLFAEPNRPIHVLELVSRDAQASAELSGDAGELLDTRALQSYRDRARELQDELNEAEGFRDAGRIAKARRELEFLSAELARATSLGGRVRRAASASERARSSVQRRIRNVFERIRKNAPELAEELERTVKTGTYCVFTPVAQRG